MWYDDCMRHPTEIIVLGGGRVGAAIALDLAADASFSVTVADRDPARAGAFPAGGPVRFVEADLGRPGRVGELVAPFDLVIGAVPGWLGFETLRAAIASGKDVVDISFFEEDPFELDALAREQGVTAVVDCGVAPGLSNLILGRLERELDRIDSFTCLVGGLPERPTPPWNYKAPYSPADVLEIYTRPARIVRGGKIVTVPALTEPEEIDFPELGRLEAFNTDGLRTLLSTTSVPELKEKTLRYPGHRAQVELLASGGFLDREREVDGALLRPRDVSARLLYDQWFQGENDHDVTVMRLVVEGESDGRTVRRTYDLCDRFDHVRGVSSMARTTGYPCTAVARLIARGRCVRRGIVPPEYLGADPECFAAILTDLERRGVVFRVSEEHSSALVHHAS
jgi:saccharopine dehydrogenase-like NADP-dependent oxidoreductase